MKYKYISASNAATNGVAIGADNQDVTVLKIIFGTPGDGEYVELHNIINPVAGATTNMVAKVTQPTAAAGKDWVREVNFGEKGVRLGEGGNVVTDSNQVTVLWDLTANVK